MFNNGSWRSADNIVADETEASATDNALVTVFLWDDPYVSLCWFLTLQVVFYLLVFAQYSLLTISTFMAAWQLIVDFAIIKISPSLKQLGFLRYDFDAPRLVRAHTFFSVRLIRQVGAAVYETADLLTQNWYDIVCYGGWPNVLLAVRILITVFIRSYSMAITMWIVLLIFFTVPLSYSSRNLFADATRELFRIKGYMRIIPLRDMAWQTSEYLGQCAVYNEDLHRRTGSPTALFKMRYFKASDALVSAVGVYAQRFAAWMESSNT